MKLVRYAAVLFDAGHMQHVLFAMPDADHHTEEWTFLDHGKEMKELFTLQRSK